MKLITVTSSSVKTPLTFVHTIRRKRPKQPNLLFLKVVTTCVCVFQHKIRDQQITGDTKRTSRWDGQKSDPLGPSSSSEYPPCRKRTVSVSCSLDRPCVFPKCDEETTLGTRNRVKGKRCPPVYRCTGYSSRPCGDGGVSSTTFSVSFLDPGFVVECPSCSLISLCYHVR